MNNLDQKIQEALQREPSAPEPNLAEEVIHCFVAATAGCTA